MSRRVEFVWPDELVAGVDRVRGDVSRSRWVLRVVEAALGERPVGVVPVAVVSSRAVGVGKGEFRPRPKGGKS